MKYRTKIMFTLVAVALFANGVSMLYMYFKSKQYLFEQIETTVRSIVDTAAPTVDGDRIQQLQPGSEGSEAYKQIAAHLKKLRNANRREDVFVKYIYTLHLCQQPGGLCFGVDPEENPEEKSKFGEPAPTEHIPGGKFDLQQPGAVDHFIHDKWGDWVSAWAPIRDGSGTAVASLGVDVSARDVRNKLNVLLYASGIALAGSIVLAVGVSSSMARLVTKPLDVVRGAVECIGQGNLDTRIELRSRDEFGEVGEAINNMVAGLKEKGVILKLFARYVSEDVAEKIVESGERSDAVGLRKRVTLLFSDIRGFTSLSETLPPEEVVKCLNEYFECMIPVITRHHGTLDKFMGDGLMVHFGAVNDDPEQEEHAVRTALDMQEALVKLGDRWEAQGKKRIAIGVGINSGIAIVGSIGSAERMEYTTIGDTVNLAARLEPLTKELGAPIIISDYTYVAIKHHFRMEYLGEHKIRGKEEPVRLYTVLGRRGQNEAAPLALSSARTA
jgi:adenylate cyclase